MTQYMSNAKKLINDGGPAFPVPSYVNSDGETHSSQIAGMSLRDWFAGHALAGLIAHNGLVDHKSHSVSSLMDDSIRNLADEGECAHWAECIVAYEVADAMIAARK